MIAASNQTAVHAQENAIFALLVKAATISAQSVDRWLTQRNALRRRFAYGFGSSRIH